MQMTASNQRLAGALAALIAIGFAAPADAKCPPGQAKKGNCAVEQSHGKANARAKAKGPKHDRGADRAAAARPVQRIAPAVAVGAGSAALAASGREPVVVDRLWNDSAVVVGDRLGISRYQPISDPLLFGLPYRTDDLAYYRVGDRIVLADPDGYIVREVVDGVSPNRFCPPGLAKKEPACIPPGQVDKIMRTEWDEDRFLPIADYSRYGLTEPDGDWGYYVVDNTIVRVDQNTREVLSLVRLIDAIL